MFGGLEVKGASTAPSQKKTDDENNENTAPSGFSFMSTPSAAPAEPEHEPAPSASGFSFMSSVNDVPKETEEVEEVPEATSTAQSGFSFMTNIISDENLTQNQEEEKEEKENVTESTQDENAVSGFSFLSTAAATTTDEVGNETSETKIAETPIATASSSTTTTVPKDDTNSNKKETNNSLFSMLSTNLGTSESSLNVSTTPSTTIDLTSPSSTWGISTKPPLPTSTSATAATQDILSQSNPSQPTGSGIVFGGAAKPKPVKKKARGKKIGAGSSATTASTPVVTTSSLPEPSSFIPSSNLHNDGDSQVSTSEMEYETPSTTATGKTLSDEAEAAAHRAEQFIASKMTSSSTSSTSSYMGRYSYDKTIVEDYGDSSPAELYNKSNNNSSDEYKKAAAAAKEAKQLEASHRKMGFGISSLFKRSFSGPTTGSKSDISNDSTHTETSLPSVRKTTEWKVPTYGDPNENFDDQSSLKHHDHDEDEELRERRLEELRLEMEREKELKDLERRKMERELHEREMMEKKQAEVERKRKLEEEEKERLRKIEEEAAKRRTPGQELSNMIQKFSVLSQNTTCSISEMRQERLTLIEKQSAAEKQEHLATQQISQAEKQQMAAAEQEDFELADRLAAVIEQHENEKNEHSQSRQSIEGLIQHLDEKRSDKCRALLSCFEDVQFQLNEFLAKQENSDIKDSCELMNKFEQDTKRLASENERLSADLKTIERDEALAQEERAELEDIISEQTKDIEILREAASAKLIDINDEIEELRKQLAEKEMQAAEVKMELHSHEESIERIRGTFSRQLTRLSKKEAAIEESRKDWTAEEASYKKSREDHEAEVTAHSEALIVHDQLISQIKEEIEVTEQLVEVIANEVVVTDSNNNAVSKEIINAQSEVLRCEAAADEANEVLNAAKAAIDVLVEEISTIEVRLPILEAEKNQAASKRDFKAAGKASKTIKEMTSRKERCEEELSGEAVERQATAQGEVDACLQILDEKKAILHEKEKEGGRKRMIQLVKKIFKLEKLREDICGTGEEEGNGESMKIVGGFVLDSEIAALVSEGEDLGEKFGGWNEIMLEYAEGNDGETDTHEVDDTVTQQTDTNNEEDIKDDKSNLDEKVNEDSTEKDIQEENTTTIIDEGDKVEAEEHCKAILSDIERLEAEIEIAIDEEDFDSAAELDEKIQKLKNDMKALGLTEQEIESLKIHDSESSNDSKESQQTEKSYDIVPSKPEVIDDDTEEPKTEDIDADDNEVGDDDNHEVSGENDINTQVDTSSDNEGDDKDDQHQDMKYEDVDI